MENTTADSILVYSLSEIPADYTGYVLHDRGLGLDSTLYWNGDGELTFIESTTDYIPHSED